MEHFNKLNAINVNDRTEEKNGLTYLSWAWAWAEVKKVYPEANYNIKRFENNLPYVFDARTGYMVFTDITIEGITHEMWLPVMDGANKAMLDRPYTYKTNFGEKSVAPATMFDVNKTIMRCLVKNLAMFGLGLYIYAGEDLPESENNDEAKTEKAPAKETPKAPAKAIEDTTPKEQPQKGMTLQEAKKTKLTFGKYSGLTLGEIDDGSYLEWLADKAMHEIMRTAAKVVLEARKPQEQQIPEPVELQGTFFTSAPPSDDDLPF